MTHLALEGDAAHVLNQLTDTHAGTIDAIVIDPPYDEGRPGHWKMSPFTYSDSRGSAWGPWLHQLLTQAKPLAKPGAPVAVSIGHARIHELAMILKGAYPEREIITITVDTGHRAAARGVIHRAEYVVITIEPGTVLGAPGFTQGEVRTGWQGAVLSGFSATDQPNQVYPVWVRDGRIIGVGRSVQQLIADGDLASAAAFDYADVEQAPVGAISLWPITRNGRRSVWRLSHASAATAIEEGWIRADEPRMPGQSQPFVVKFLGTATRKRIAAGELATHGLDDRGALIVDRARPVGAAVPTIWTGAKYESEAGTARLAELVGPGRFAYPKPVGLIADIVTAVTRGKPNARILDFFAGTGTLFDAVTELNTRDGGNREAVMVTLDEGDIFEVLAARCKAVTAARGEAIELRPARALTAA